MSGGWNRPSEAAKKTAAEGEAEQRKNRLLLRGGVAALIVVVGALVAWWLLSGGETKVRPPEVKSPRPAIKEVKPTPAPVSDEDSTVIKPSKHKRVPKKLPVDRTGKVSTPYISSNSIVVAYGVVNGKSIFKKPIFKHTSENVIHAVLTQQPGLRVIDVPLGDDFVEDFKASMKEPIRAEPGDSEEALVAKQDMVDVKAELMERMRNGESVAKIVSDAREDLNRIADYADQVKQAYRDSLRESEDPKEWESLRKKANEMLEAHGVPPILPAKRGKFKVPDELLTDEK